MTHPTVEDQVRMPLPKGLRRRLSASPRVSAAYYAILARDLRREDVLMVHYPKAGSHWLRFMLHELAFGRGGSTFEEIDVGLCPIQRLATTPVSDAIRGRLVYSYYPLLGTRARTIYLCRDGRDVAVSLYRHLNWRDNLSFGPSFERYLDDFLGRGFGASGNWSDHVNRGLDYFARDSSSTTLLRYEDLLENTAGEMRRLVTNLGLDFSNQEISGAVAKGGRSRMLAAQARSETVGSEGYSFVGSTKDRSSSLQALTGPQYEKLTEKLSSELNRLGYVAR